MKTIYKITMLVFAASILTNCQITDSVDIVPQYSDCSRIIQIAFVLNNDWTYDYCTTDYLSASKMNERTYIDIYKIKTDQISIDSVVTSNNNRYKEFGPMPITEGYYEISNSEAYYWELPEVYNNTYMNYVTYKSGYIFDIRYISYDPNTYNKKEFEDFINSIIIE